ncbi:amidohydrolase [uncultured Selenomonas sp.]|uniref:amidohydrolase n=1 Tax=uncultured Selenomonas sp. TaxID=159275 RepID=UPI0028E51F0F|nr:amidohydrolase [uncultured Selenomonas sp.]
MAAIENIEAYIAEEFQWFHRHPELSYEEIETTKRIRASLERAGIRILDLPLKTGLVAEVGQGKPLVALRTDIDALPIEEQTDLPYRSEYRGRMHACGHDFHISSVLGAALLLKQHEAELTGRVRIFFQPAEEAPGGAKVLIEAGALKDVAAIFGLHASPLMEVGTVGVSEGAVMAAVDRFVFRFHGTGTHAAHPESGVDPIVLAAAFIQSVQTVVARNLNPFSAGLVSVTHIAAGNTWNVIPEEALVEGTTRSMNAEERTHIRTRVCALAEQLAAAYGAAVEMDWYEGPPATVNDAFWASFAEETAKARNLNVVLAPQSLGGEDFAFYQEKVPGMFVLVGTGLSAAIHNPTFRVDPRALAPTACYLAELVRGALEKVKER